MIRLAGVLMRNGELIEAVKLNRVILEKIKNLEGVENVSALCCRAMSTLGESLMKTGEFDEAVKLFRTVLEMTQNVKDTYDWIILREMKNIAEELVKKEDFDEAVEHFRNIVIFREGFDGAEAVWTLEAKIDLANVLMLKEEFDEARTLYEGVYQTSSSCNITFEDNPICPLTLLRKCETRIRWVKIQNSIRSSTTDKLNADGNKRRRID